MELLTMVSAIGAEVASFTYQAEKTATQSPGLAQPTILINVLIGAIGVVVGAAASIIVARLRVPQELQIEYDRDLRARRIEHYTKLWSSMLPLAKYPPPDPLPYDNVRQLSMTLRRWYFRGGGLFMSKETRDTYFNLQDGLKIVLQKQKGSWPDHLRGIDEANPECRDRLKNLLKEHLQRDKDWKPPEYVLKIANDDDIGNLGVYLPDSAFDNLRGLGSSLRTSMTRDIVSRVTPYLKGRIPT
jgi:hypothetical protein